MHLSDSTYRGKKLGTMSLSLRLRLCCCWQRRKLCGDFKLIHEGGELLTNGSVIGHTCQLRKLVQSCFIATESRLHERRDVRSRASDKRRFGLCGRGFFVDTCEVQAIRRDERPLFGAESARMRTRALAARSGVLGRDFSDDACARAMRESQTDNEGNCCSLGTHGLP